MSDMTNYLEQKLLEATVNNKTFTGPRNLYVGLYTSDPTENGTAGTEVNNSRYERQVIIFTEPISSVVSNTNTIKFDATEESYGNITHVGVLDAQTGGNMLFYKALQSAIVAGEGVGIRIQQGSLTIELD